MYNIYDAHCHIYPETISLKAVAAVDTFYDHLPAEHYDGTTATLVKSGAMAGITHYLVHSVATRPHQVSSINRFIAAEVAASQGAFTGLGTMHLDSEDLRRDFEELRALGLRGVKLHPDIQRFEADAPRAMEIYGMCEDAGLPVLVHTGDYRYDYSNPQRIARILRAFPRLQFVGAVGLRQHIGGLLLHVLRRDPREGPGARARLDPRPGDVRHRLSPLAPAAGCGRAAGHGPGRRRLPEDLLGERGEGVWALRVESEEWRVESGEWRVKSTELLCQHIGKCFVSGHR